MHRRARGEHSPRLAHIPRGPIHILCSILSCERCPSHAQGHDIVHRDITNIIQQGLSGEWAGSRLHANTPLIHKHTQNLCGRPILLHDRSPGYLMQGSASLRAETRGQGSMAMWWWPASLANAACYATSAQSVFLPLTDLVIWITVGTTGSQRTIAVAAERTAVRAILWEGSHL